MTSPLIVIGAGGFGREVLDVVEAINDVRPTWDILGVIDDAISAANASRLEARGYEHLGGLDVLAAIVSLDYVVGIGSPQVRVRIADEADAMGHRAATLVHPLASIGSAGSVGEGTVICAGARVTTNVSIGRHVHLNPAVTVGHDSTLHDFVSANPQAAISGDVSVGAGALLGATSVVLQGVSVGANAVVGAAACVVRDVDPGRTVKGVPAR